ncbi:MAG: hypothetical protein M0Z27_12165 [Thermaerobacter sp.]|nr:hypothetical protein [Thermaerobacter sp.]
MPPGEERFTVAQLWETAVHRVARAELAGRPCGTVIDPERQLHLTLAGRWEGPQLGELRFAASTCATLVALVEAACRALEGEPSAALREVTAVQVLGLVADLPAGQAWQAELVARSCRQLARALEGEGGGVYLCHPGPHRFVPVGQDDPAAVGGGTPRRPGGGQVLLRGQQLHSDEGNPLGERLAAVARRDGILLMGCDQCCYERGIADRLSEGLPIGCFPDLYRALAPAGVDQVITL